MRLFVFYWYLLGVLFVLSVSYSHFYNIRYFYNQKNALFQNNIVKVFSFYFLKTIMHLRGLKFEGISRYTCNWFKMTRAVKKFTCFPMFGGWIGSCGKQQCDVTDINAVSPFFQDIYGTFIVQSISASLI